MNIIEVKNLSTIFGTNIVHKDISFKVKKNEIFGVLGGSGSGKTTLVKQIVMLQKIQKGEIKLLNQNLSSLSLAKSQNLKKDIAFLFQFGALFSFLNVIENISVTLKEYTKLPDKLIEQIAYTKLKLVGLPISCAKLYPSELSGGMRKKVALARAIASDPKILFLDEPTSGLDPASAENFNTLIKELRNMLDITIIIITHDLDTIKKVLDRFILINNSKIVFDGDMNSINNSKDKFIHDFFKKED